MYNLTNLKDRFIAVTTILREQQTYPDYAQGHLQVIVEDELAELAAESLTHWNQGENGIPLTLLNEALRAVYGESTHLGAERRDEWPPDDLAEPS